MKKAVFVALACVCLAIPSFGQSRITVANLNFGFEKSEDEGILPDNWHRWGNGYTLKSDSLVRHRGKVAIRMEPSEQHKSGSIGGVVYKLPAPFDCKEIEVRAWLKSKDIAGGSAKLLLWIEDASGKVHEAKGTGEPIKGTTDWTRYSIKIPYPKNAKSINLGAALKGGGQLWVDDFELLVDGNNILLAKYREYPADQDKEFDTGSGIKDFNLSAEKVTDLKILGMVWGYLKYYHPGVATGNFNWDYELLRILPLIIDAKNAVERDIVLLDLTRRLGDFKVQKKSIGKNVEIKISPDLNWINRMDLSTELVAKLTLIRNAQRTDDNYYIGLFEDAGNPEFKNERAYPSMNYPDIGFRLISLYRYWNMIQYFFPYKNLIEEDWKDVLSEFIPKYVNASNGIEYKEVVLELIARIHDTHATLSAKDATLNDYYGRNYSSAEMSFIENKAVVTGFYGITTGAKSELQVGDVISKINNIPVEEIVIKRLKYTSASNYPTQLRNLAAKLLRSNDTIISIEYRRGGVHHLSDIPAYPVKYLIDKKYPDHDTCFKMIHQDIGYIFPGLIKNKYLPGIMNEIKNTHGLIIDLRCYPSDFVVFSLNKFLMPDSTPIVKFTNGSVSTPGLFAFRFVIKAGIKNPNYYKGKVVILVNEETQSQAEYTAMALRASPNAVIVGSTTAGADGDTSTFDLPGGLTSKFSGIGWYYPDGRETQRVGIVPDIEFKPTLKGIQSGVDELLGKAIEIIYHDN